MINKIKSFFIEYNLFISMIKNLEKEINQTL